MIVFDLACRDGGHVFEAWFGSSDDYKDQRGRGLLSCPICGAAQVDKALMAPNVSPKSNRLPVRAKTERAVSLPMAGGAPAPEAMKAMLGKLAKLQAKVLEGSEYVGSRFAEEARSIHLGDTEHRVIHGQATIEEARSLVEDGVPIAPLPLPVRPPGQDN